MDSPKRSYKGERVAHDPIFEVVIDSEGVPMFKFLRPFLLNDMLKYNEDFKAIERIAQPGQRYVFYPTYFDVVEPPVKEGARHD